MKKLLSIALLLLFLFNVLGYYLVFWGLRYQAFVEMNDRLETENYSAIETMTIKIPLMVPYYTDSEDYDRVRGAFEHHGDFFKLVKQKLERDTLYVVCIKDHNEKRIFNAMTNFVKLSNDLPASSQQTLKLLSSYIKDYAPTSPTNAVAHDGWSLAIHFIQLRFDLLAHDLPILSPPPDFIA